MKSSRKRMTRLLAFGPAFILVCVTAYVASGASVVSSATAVSTAGVTGTVATAGSTDPDVSDASCTGENSAGGEALAATWVSTLQTTDGCKLTFWTNNATGATVNYVNTFGAAAAFFCLDPTPGTGTPGDRDCSTDAKRAENVGAGGAIGNASDLFGIALTSLGGSATNGTGATAAPVANPTTASAVWYPITGAAAELCKTTASNTSGAPADCTFKLGGSGEATQGAGTYYGNATLTITQNP